MGWFMYIFLFLLSVFIFNFSRKSRYWFLHYLHYGVASFINYLGHLVPGPLLVISGLALAVNLALDKLESTYISIETILIYA